MGHRDISRICPTYIEMVDTYGVCSIEVIEGSIPFNPMLCSDRQWCCKTSQKQEASSSVKM